MTEKAGFGQAPKSLGLPWHNPVNGVHGPHCAQEPRLPVSRPTPGTQPEHCARGWGGQPRERRSLAAPGPAHRGPAPPTALGETAGAGPDAADPGRAAGPPIRLFPTRAGGRTCSSTVLGVTFTVWRRPFGASTDTAEPPPPAGAAIFRSRDRSRLASNNFIRNSRDAQPRGLGGGADSLPAGPRLRPRRPSSALMNYWRPDGAAQRLLPGRNTFLSGALSLHPEIHVPGSLQALETACKKAMLPAASLGPTSYLSATKCWVCPHQSWPLYLLH